MSGGEVIMLMGAMLTVLGLIVGAFYKVRGDAREDVKDAKQDAAEAYKRAEDAYHKAAGIELTVAKEYVSQSALNAALATVRQQIQDGFEHVHEKIDLILKKG